MGDSTPAASGHRLSKTRVMVGLQCHRRLWWTVHEPEAAELVAAPALQALFDEGGVPRPDPAGRAIAVERLAARPDFFLRFEYHYNGAVRIPNRTIPIADFWSAFLGVRLPVWAWRKQLRLADAARADSAAAAAELRQAELDVGQEVIEMAARVGAEQRRLTLLIGGVLPAARATTESARQSYQVGRVEFLTVVAVQDALFRAELEAAAVAADLATHLVMLRELTREEPQS